MPEHGRIILVPSVHYSARHRRRVRETIRDERPDVVAVELDEGRYDRLRHRVDADELARQLPPATAVAYSTLKAIQESVVRLYGLDPGQTDMEAAIDAAAELDADVALVDDSLEAVFTELSRRVDLTTVPKLLLRWRLMGPRAYADQFEAMTLPFRSVESGDDVQAAVDHLRRLLPEVATVLVDERDRAMAERLHALRTEGHDVVAVVGAAHDNGIRRHLDALEGTDARPPVDVPIRTPGKEVTEIPIE